MGLGHDIETILKAANILKSNNDIQFVFIGHGPGYKIVEDYLTHNTVTNVLLLPLQPKELFPFSIASADIGIVSQEKGMEGLFMPSKTYDMMAAGLAIIGISDGENDLKDVINKYNLGFNIKSGSPSQLADAIQTLKKNTDALKVYKANARNAIENDLNPIVIYEEYLKTFKGVLTDAV